MSRILYLFRDIKEGNLLEQLAAQLVADSIEFELPDLIPRNVPIAEGKNLASVMVGMRRVGKSWRLFQKMQELYGKGVPRERVLYLNVEDERLGDVDARLLRAVEQAYFRRFPEHRCTQGQALACRG